MMTQRKIRISTIAEAKDFVARASECDFDINIFYNRVIIDAKSILGPQPGLYKGPHCGI